MPVTNGQRKQVPTEPMRLEPHAGRGLVSYFHGSSDVSSHFFSSPPFFLVQFFATRLLHLWYMIILLTSGLTVSGTEAVGVSDLDWSPSSSIIVCAFGQVA